MLTLDHVAIEVSNMDTSIAFYTQKLGLELMFDKTDVEHHERFAFLKLDGGNLELLQPLDESNQPKPFVPIELRASNCPHIALVAEDLDALMSKVAQENIPVLKGPLEIPGQVRWVYLLDPDNNILEFVQWFH
ncbi:MAG TPA: VOC family protein [Candidatus Hydrogenedentes bacterium]|nr:VOC family protein [Candidatus Hydrogenedentota bacterium]